MRGTRPGFCYPGLVSLDRKPPAIQEPDSSGVEFSKHEELMERAAVHSVEIRQPPVTGATGSRAALAEDWCPR